MEELYDLHEEILADAKRVCKFTRPSVDIAFDQELRSVCGPKALALGL